MRARQTSRCFQLRTGGSISSWTGVSFFVPRMFASCFTVNHRGKPGPLPRLVRIISCPFFSFATLPGDKQVLSLVLFVSGMLPNPQLCIPLLCCRGILLGRVRGAVPTQIETCQCTLCLLWHWLEWHFYREPAYGLPKAKDRQAGRVETVRPGSCVCSCLVLIGVSPWEPTG